MEENKVDIDINDTDEEINWEEKYKALEESLKDKELDSTIRAELKENSIDDISDEDYNFLKEIKGIGNNNLYKRFLELIGSSKRGFKIGATDPNKINYSRGNSFADYIEKKREK